jgi:hypothetical protein
VVTSVTEGFVRFHTDGALEFPGAPTTGDARERRHMAVIKTNAIFLFINPSRKRGVTIQTADIYFITQNCYILPLKRKKQMAFHSFVKEARQEIPPRRHFSPIDCVSFCQASFLMPRRK